LGMKKISLILFNAKIIPRERKERDLIEKKIVNVGK